MKGLFSKDILIGIGAALGFAAIGVGGKMAYDKNKEEEDKSGESVLKYQDIDTKDSIILRLDKQQSLKPKIINDDDEFDNNYIKANSFINDEEDEEEKVKSFICPINKKIMDDPVITPYGTTYERSAILNWIEKNKTDYNSNKKLTADMLVTNYVLKASLEEYKESANLKDIKNKQ